MWNFTQVEGLAYDQWKTSVTWTDNSLNDYWYPTNGRSHTFDMFVALPSSDVRYYQAKYTYRSFKPLDITESYVASFGAQLGYADAYGDTTYIPPFANYYAGGYGSVRGFEHNTLGPFDTNTNTATGGQVLAAASGEFIFPMFTDMPSVRTMLFMDVGNVFEQGGFSASDLRASAGFSLAWLTPVGPLTLVMAQPLKSETADLTTRTHITLGRSY